jgi:hypothetical protein
MNVNQLVEALEELGIGAETKQVRVSAGDGTPPHLWPSVGSVVETDDAVVLEL